MGSSGTQYQNVVDEIIKSPGIKTDDLAKKLGITLSALFSSLTLARKNLPYHIKNKQGGYYAHPKSRNGNGNRDLPVVSSNNPPVQKIIIKDKELLSSIGQGLRNEYFSHIQKAEYHKRCAEALLESCRITLAMEMENIHVSK